MQTYNSLNILISIVLIYTTNFTSNLSFLIKICLIFRESRALCCTNWEQN